MEPPLRRFIASDDVIAVDECKVAQLHDQIEALRQLSISLDLDT